jgi:hypothetical protein
MAGYEFAAACPGCCMLPGMYMAFMLAPFMPFMGCEERLGL